jgi:hypothetical protein
VAEGISVRVFYEDCVRDMHSIDRRVDRATMWTIREVGRRIKRSARKKAPVYRGPDRIWSVDGQTFPTIRGELRDSIHSSKRLRRIPGGYSLKVGPRGGHVHLYAEQQNERTGFMDDAFAEAQPLITAIAEQAYQRATRSRR